YFSAVYLYSSADSGLHLLPHSIAISTGSVFAGCNVDNISERAHHLLESKHRCSPSMARYRTSRFWHGKSDYKYPYSGVTREDMAVATGITYLFRTTGQVLGVSISGATLQAVLLLKLRERIQGPGSMEYNQLIYEIQHSTNIIPSLSPRLRQAAIDSYADALRVVFICQAAWNFLAFLWCLPIQENILPGTPEEQVQDESDRDEETDKIPLHHSTIYRECSLPLDKANRVLDGLAGHGRMFEAETVRTVAKKVIPNNDDTNVRPFKKENARTH
ncbi:hypothetical protein MPER_10605, partial [Moniliophthora perniciosa FA553]